MKDINAVNRAYGRGMNIYCDRVCAGLGRRKGKTEAEKRVEKAQYDKLYRAANRDLLKAKKHEYFKRTHDPDQARIERRKSAQFHAEYCRRPEYREWKKSYDRKHRAHKFYGDYAECHMLMMDLRAEVLRHQSDYDIRLTKGTLSKTTKRRRDYERSHSQRKIPQAGPLGDLERGQNR